MNAGQRLRKASQPENVLKDQMSAVASSSAAAASSSKGPLSTGSFLADLSSAAQARQNKPHQAAADSLAQQQQDSGLVLANGQRVYTRKLAGDGEKVDFATEIKISSKMKLRRTNQARSPGGTPMRLDVASPEKDSFRKALQAKFKNARGEENVGKTNSSAAASGASSPKTLADVSAAMASTQALSANANSLNICNSSAGSGSVTGGVSKRRSLGQRLDAERLRTLNEVTEDEWDDGNKEN
jgi:hypothetical protein